MKNLYLVALFVLIAALVRLAVRGIFSGLLTLYDLCEQRQVDRELAGAKFTLKSVLVIMGMTGLLSSLVFIPYTIFGHVFLGLLACLGLSLVFTNTNDPSKQRQIGGALLALAIMPFILAGLLAGLAILGLALGL